MTDGVHDPAQAWNALTVGGYTEKAVLDAAAYPGWRPLAQAGDLAPCSCTSATWTKTRWTIKPDIVLEAGNMAVNDDHQDPDYIDDGDRKSTRSELKSLRRQSYAVFCWKKKKYKTNKH